MKLLIRGEQLRAWLTGAIAVLGVLVATALVLAFGEPRWGFLALALSTMLVVALGLVNGRSARPADASQQPGMPEPAAPSEEPQTGLPVYPITGLYRWWVFRQRLIEETARADRYKRHLAIVLVEPANLVEKPPPEAYALAAKALRRALRTSDFAGQYDEDRFVVLLPETDKEGAQAAGQRLLAAIRSSSEPQSRWRGALVTYPQDTADPDALLDRALIALRRGQLESATKQPSAAQGEAPTPD